MKIENDMKIYLIVIVVIIVGMIIVAIPKTVKSKECVTCSECEDTDNLLNDNNKLRQEMHDEKLQMAQLQKVINGYNK